MRAGAGRTRLGRWGDRRSRLCPGPRAPGSAELPILFKIVQAGGEVLQAVDLSVALATVKLKSLISEDAVQLGSKWVGAGETEGPVQGEWTVGCGGRLSTGSAAGGALLAGVQRNGHGPAAPLSNRSGCDKGVTPLHGVSPSGTRPWGHTAWRQGAFASRPVVTPVTLQQPPEATTTGGGSR